MPKLCSQNYIKNWTFFSMLINFFLMHSNFPYFLGFFKFSSNWNIYIIIYLIYNILLFISSIFYIKDVVHLCPLKWLLLRELVKVFSNLQFYLFHLLLQQSIGCFLGGFFFGFFDNESIISIYYFLHYWHLIIYIYILQQFLIRSLWVLCFFYPSFLLALTVRIQKISVLLE